MNARRNPSRTPKTPRRRAFTLIEVISAMVVIALLGSGASTIIYRAASAYQSSVTLAQLTSDASAALERIDRELRDIGKKSGAGVVAPDIFAVTASSIIFATTSSFSLSGTNLQVVVSGGTAATLLSNVTAFTVQAYDQDNTAMAATLSGSGCNAIRRVSVTITTSKGGSTVTLRTKVYLRCTISGAATG